MHIAKTLYLPLAAISALALLFISMQSRQGSVTAADETCQSVVTFLQPVQGQTVSGIVPIELAATPGVQAVRFEIDGMVLGRGLPTPSSGDQWGMPWDTRLTESDSSRELTAEVFYNGGYSCEVELPLDLNVQNPVFLPLQAFIEPGNWSGLTNSIALFSVEFANNTAGTIDLAKHAAIFWSVDGRGSISPEQNNIARYASGPTGGNGTVEARIRYGGQELVVDAQTQVIPQSYPGDDSTTANDEGPQPPEGPEELDEEGNPLDPDELDNEPGQEEPVITRPAEAIEQVIESDTVVGECVLSQLGEAEVAQLIEEDRRPTREEFKKYLSCFARQNYVLPSILAPIAPEEVVNRQETDRVQIQDIANSVKQLVDGAEKTVLVLSGVADPNANILLYVYSEPLVLATTADGEGNWSYSLEDPLEEGEHEVYALVEQGDGEYERSGVASFFIGSAEASEENPNGLSLELVSEPTITSSSRSVNILVASTIGVTVFTAVIVLSFGLQKVRSMKQYVPLAQDPVMNNPTDTNNLPDGS